MVIMKKGMVIFYNDMAVYLMKSEALPPPSPTRAQCSDSFIDTHATWYW